VKLHVFDANGFGLYAAVSAEDMSAPTDLAPYADIETEHAAEAVEMFALRLACDVVKRVGGVMYLNLRPEEILSRARDWLWCEFGDPSPAFPLEAPVLDCAMTLRNRANGAVLKVDGGASFVLPAGTRVSADYQRGCGHSLFRECHEEDVSPDFRTTRDLRCFSLADADFFVNGFAPTEKTLACWRKVGPGGEDAGAPRP